MKLALFCVVAFWLALLAVPDRVTSESNLFAQGKREYRTGQFAEAERDFRRVTKTEPTNIYAQFYLGQSLFRQEKYSLSVVPFEKARGLEKTGKKLSSDEHRILVDQLAMAYGMSGDFKKAQQLLNEAIQEDPDYPLNYYNLACAYAEQGNKPEMLANLSRAFERRDKVLKGEELPNPRDDSSFQKYSQDEDFVKLLKRLGYD